MTKDDKEYVLNKIDNEGFHYCFVHYSDFKEIKDERFHQLRENCLKSMKDLEKYLKSKD